MIYTLFDFIIRIQFKIKLFSIWLLCERVSNMAPITKRYRHFHGGAETSDFNRHVFFIIHGGEYISSKKYLIPEF